MGVGRSHSDEGDWLRSVLLSLALASLGLTASIAQAQGGAVIEVRGEATYRIPIVVPPGPAGHQPDLALVYNSGDGKGPAGWVGFGWSVSGESRIERETRTGTPYDFDNTTCGAPGNPPCYRSSFTLDGQDLICDQGSCAACTAAPFCRYRTQSDDGRIILYKGATAGWAIHDRDGQKLDYGPSAPSRLLNPMSGEVFSWQIEKSTDVNGNEIRFLYDTFSSPNVAYLQRITWGQGSAGNRSADFILNDPTTAARPDKPLTARPGFRQQIDRRVVRIDVRADSSAFVARYALGYTQDPDSRRSQLATVQRVDSANAAILPPHTFSYSFREQNEGFRQVSESSFDGGATSCPPSGGVNVGSGKMTRNVADMNRDGLADLFALSEGTYSSDLPEVSLGTGTRFRPGPSMSCSDGIRGTIWANEGLPFWRSGAAASTDDVVLDIDGDGFLGTRPPAHRRQI